MSRRRPRRVVDSATVTEPWPVPAYSAIPHMVTQAISDAAILVAEPRGRRMSSGSTSNARPIFLQATASFELPQLASFPPVDRTQLLAVRPRDPSDLFGRIGTPVLPPRRARPKRRKNSDDILYLWAGILSMIAVLLV